MKTCLLILSIIICYPIFSQESGGPYVPNENTVLLMHFDGDVNNSATVGNNGIIQGSGATFENNGVHGQCIRLDNSTFSQPSWIEVPFYNELNFSEEFSIECWFKINSWGENTSGIRSLFRKEGNGWSPDHEVILFSEGSSLQANLDCIDDEDGEWGIDAGTSDILELNKWYHIAMYYNHAHKHMYLLIRDENYKEIFAARGYAETPPVNSEGKFMIAYGGWSESLFDGWIDEFRISNIYRKYRDDVIDDIDESTFADEVFLPLKDGWVVYQWPLGEFYPVNNETGEINRANACGPTMLMRTIHYWEYPRYPSGVIEHNMENCNWYADFDNTEYLWDQIPFSFVNVQDEEDYAPSATFSAQVGTASMEHFDNMYCMPGFLKENFLFSEKTRVLFREEYTKEEWEKIFKNELNQGRPIMIGGVEWRTSTGGGGHYYICNGYNNDNQFFTDFSFNDNFWADIDEFDYGISQDIIIFMEPDWGDKSLVLNNPTVNQVYQQGGSMNIQWSEQNINLVMLEYSTDAGYNWHTIAESVDATGGSYQWAIPDIVSTEYKIRISDVENMNMNQRSGKFEVYETQDFVFDYPIENSKLLSAAEQPIYWHSTGVQNFKLEFTVNGTDWETISESADARQNFKFQFPVTNEPSVKLKATDLLNPDLVRTSEEFSLYNIPVVNGVKVPDEYTVLLMHFEEDLNNSASSNLIPIEGMPIGYFEGNYELNLGKSYRFDNSDGTPLTHNIWIDNSEALDMGNNWSIEAWVNVKSIGGEHNVGGLIVDKWEALGINAAWHHFNAFVNFENGTNVEFSYPDAYVLNQWYHVAMISDAAREHIYFYVHDSDFNKLYEEIKAFPEGSNGSVAQSDYLLKVGGLGGASNLEFDGFMDEIRVSKTSYLSLYNPSGINDNTKNGISLNIYPNPISGSTIISFQTNTYGNVNLSVYDIQGRKICTLLDKTLNAGVHTIPIENSISNSGVYYCRMATSKDVRTLKLIVR